MLSHVKMSAFKKKKKSLLHPNFASLSPSVTLAKGSNSLRINWFEKC